MNFDDPNLSTEPEFGNLETRVFEEMLVLKLAMAAGFIGKDTFDRLANMLVSDPTLSATRLLIDEAKIGAEGLDQLETIRTELLSLCREVTSNPAASIDDKTNVAQATLAIDQVVQTFAAQDFQNQGSPDDQRTTVQDSVADATQGMAKPATVERYRRLYMIGEGGQAVVHLSWDIELKRTVAIKSHNRKNAPTREDCERFVREAQFTGRLNHPAVIPIYTLGKEDDGVPFLVFPYYPKGEMSKEIAQLHATGDTNRLTPAERELKLRELLDLLKKVCQAAAHAHDRNVIHRDIKPKNILIGHFGAIYLADWGLAKSVASSDPTYVAEGAGDAGSGSREVEEGICGTISFMSPEQALGKASDHHFATDVFLLGATLYDIITGRPPFYGSSKSEILRAAQECDYRKPREIDPSIDATLESICCKAMAPEPRDRYPSALALANDLERWLADLPPLFVRESFGKSMGRKLRRHSRSLAAASAILLIGSVGLFATNRIITRDRDRAVKAENAERNSRMAESAAKDQAIENFKLAQSAANDIYGIIAEQMPLWPGSEPFRFRAAETLCEFFEKILASAHADDTVRWNTAQAEREAGNVGRLIGEKITPEAHYEKALKLLNELSAERRNESKCQLMIALTLIDFAVRHQQMGRYAEAQAAIRQALSIVEQPKVREEDPEKARYAQFVALSARASLFSELGDVVSENADLQEAKRLQDLIFDQKKQLDRQDHKMRLIIIVSQGHVARKMKRWDEAIALFDQAIELATTDKKQDQDIRFILAQANHGRGLSTEKGAQAGPAALSYYVKAYNLLGILANASPRVQGYRVEFAQNRFRRARAERLNGKLDADQNPKPAMKELLDEIIADRDIPSLRATRGMIIAEQARFERDRKKEDQARALAALAAKEMDLAASVLKDHPDLREERERLRKDFGL